MDNSDVLVRFRGETKDLDEKTKKAKNNLNNFAKTASKTFGTGMAIAAGAATAAIAGIGAAILDITKKSVNAYAEYEQLIGGVETLFKESADKVEENANRAYMTAGLSANEYMATITSFSASLLQSLGNDTNKAADYADRAIQDMSDNANKMGTDMALIQSAYQGFAKQNYTMLDNLKLGYGGTRGEMERLLADAEKISGIHYDISSFADMTEAIHVIQTEMGITGTTAKEAMGTISGSLRMTQSAWENLIAGLSKSDADLDGLIQNVVDSAMAFVNNVIPVVERAINGIATALPSMVEKIGELLPDLLEDLLPPLIDACLTLIKSLAKNLPKIIKILGDAIIQAAIGLLDLLPDIIDAILGGAIALIEVLADSLPTLLPKLIEAVINGVLRIVDYLPEVIKAAIQLLMGLVKAIPEIITALTKALPDLITTIINCLIDGIPELIVGAIQLLMAIIEAIPTIIGALIEAIPEIIIALVDALTSNESLQQIDQAGRDLLSQMIDGIKSSFENIWNVGKDLVLGLWNGINDQVGWIVGKIQGFGDSVIGAMKSIFGIHSPSTEFEWIGKMNVEGLEKGMEEMQPQLQKTINGVFDLQPNISGQMSSNYSPQMNVVVNNNMEFDPLGQVVNKIKTFSGGAKNDYNWGATL